MKILKNLSFFTLLALLGLSSTYAMDTSSDHDSEETKNKKSTQINGGTMDSHSDSSSDKEPLNTTNTTNTTMGQPIIIEEPLIPMDKPNKKNVTPHTQAMLNATKILFSKTNNPVSSEPNENNNDEAKDEDGNKKHKKASKDDITLKNLEHILSALKSQATINIVKNKVTVNLAEPIILKNKEKIRAVSSIDENNNNTSVLVGDTPSVSKTIEEGVYESTYADVQALFLAEEWYNDSTYRWYATLRKNLIASVTLSFITGATLGVGAVYGTLKYKQKKDVEIDKIDEIDIDEL